ncbi:hypothetical protein SAMN05216174_11311 [Actinokineospora iranica]|uniref:Uncharacterized protein n=1 Tax=Actinokineospora iranica TaxID=1271860 RepID=A0A1G6VND5_9PSEU|nr:hypothetical protein SAMN05216174_11311 [Actinokineospora iranica]
MDLRVIGGKGALAGVWLGHPGQRVFGGTAGRYADAVGPVLG